MTVKARDFRIPDIGGGLNIREDAGSIKDNQSQVLNNMRTNGSYIQSIEGHELLRHVDDNTRKGLITVGKWAFTFTEPLLSPAGQFQIYPFNTQDGIYPTPSTFTIGIAAGGTSFYGFGWNDLGRTYICVMNRNDLDWITYGDVKVLKLEDNYTLTDVTLTFSGSPSKEFSAGIYYEGRLILGWSRSEPATVYFSRPSSPSSPQLFSDFTLPGFSQRVGEGNETITGFAVSSEKLLALTKDSIYGGTIESTTTKTGSTYTSSGSPAVITSSADQFTTAFLCNFKKVSNTGNESATSFVNVNHDLFFFDGDSIRRLGYEENISAIRDSAISDNVKTLFPQLPYQNNIRASYVFPLVKYFFRTSARTGSVNDIALVYNVMDKSFSTQTIGVGACGSILIKWEQTPIFLSSFTGDVMKLLPELVSSYDGEEVREEYVSKEYSVFDDVDFKRYTQVELSGRGTDGTKAIAEVWVDKKLVRSHEFTIHWDKSPTIGGITFGTITLGSNSPSSNLGDYFERIELFNDGRYVTIKVRKIGNGFIQINPPTFRYRPVNAYPIH